MNAADDLGYTPLHVATKHGHLEAARCLLDHGAAVNYGCDEAPPPPHADCRCHRPTSTSTGTGQSAACTLAAWRSGQDRPTAVADYLLGRIGSCLRPGMVRGPGPFIVNFFILN